MDSIRRALTRFWASLRARTWIARVLVAAGFVSLLLGIGNGFIRVNVYETQPFATNALQAFQDDSVKQLIADKLADNLIGRAPAVFKDEEPILSVLLFELMRTSRFERIFREAAVEANQVFFGKNTDQPALDLSDAGPLIQSIVEQVDPSLADALPTTIEDLLVEVSATPAVNRVVSIAEDARDTTFLWPSLAFVLFLLGIAVSPRRNRTTVAVGVLLAVGGLLLAAGAQAIRAFVLSDRGSSATADAARAAADAFVEDAPVWGLLMALAGALLAGAASADAVTGGFGGRVRGVWELVARRPANAWLAVVRAAALGAVGAFAIFQPDLALTIAVVAGGFLLLLFAFTEALQSVRLVGGRAAPVLPWLIAFAGVVSFVVVGIVVLTP